MDYGERVALLVHRSTSDVAIGGQKSASFGSSLLGFKDSKKALIGQIADLVDFFCPGKPAGFNVQQPFKSQLWGAVEGQELAGWVRSRTTASERSISEKWGSAERLHWRMLTVAFGSI